MSGRPLTLYSLNSYVETCFDISKLRGQICQQILYAVLDIFIISDFIRHVKPVVLSGVKEDVFEDLESQILFS